MTNELDSDVVILGCTELSVAQERAGNHDFNVVDAQSVLVDKTIEMAKNKKRAISSFYFDFIKLKK